tara:strand:+ start:237 stop:416 length:180 start_codon:yes stop_codon:yes gene_type:complete
MHSAAIAPSVNVSPRISHSTNAVIGALDIVNIDFVATVTSGSARIEVKSCIVRSEAATP